MTDAPIMVLSPALEAQQLIDDAARIIAQDLQISIAKLPYTVGRGVAPHPTVCLAAGTEIATRFLDATLATIEGERALEQLAALGWQPIATADRYGPSLDLYDQAFDKSDDGYGTSWDGHWTDADGTDHPETGGHWVAAVWCNSHDEWHSTRINPTHWRRRPLAPSN